MKRVYIILFAVVTVMFSSCVTNDDSPGLEYMPDMYRSPAIEAYVDYGFDEFKPGMTADSAAYMRDQQSVRIPPAGTIKYVEPEKMVFNMPYPYPNTAEGYEEAGANWKSPIATSKENIAAGKVLFERFCIQCHGEKGEGDGTITKYGKYPPVPSYSSRKGLPEGKMFHTITFGKGLMGSHAYFLNQEERWLVIQYVKELMGDNPEMTDAESSDSEDMTESAEGDDHEGHDHEGENHDHEEGGHESNG